MQALQVVSLLREASPEPLIFHLGRKIRQVLPTLLYVDAAGGK